MEWSICIGLITNRTFLGDSYIRFNCVFLIYMGRFDGRYGFEIFHSREPFYFERGSGIRLIGRHFAFFISENGRPWLHNPITSTLQDSQQKNSVLNHRDHWIGIGFNTNLTDLGDRVVYL